MRGIHHNHIAELTSVNYSYNIPQIVAGLSMGGYGVIVSNDQPPAVSVVSDACAGGYGT